MKFKHTEDRQMLVDMIARYLQNEYTIADRNKAAETDLGFAPDQWSAMAELGIFGAFFGEEQGGFGGSGFDVAAVFEELGRALVVEPLLDNVVIPGRILLGVGDQARLTEVMDGSLRLAVSLEEHNVLSATKSGARWVVSGTASMVKFAHGSDCVLVAAQTGIDAHQLSLFLVPKDAPNLQFEHHALFDGGSVSDVTLNGVNLCEADLIGPLDGASDTIADARAWGCLGLCAEALGIMEKIKLDTLDYLRTRKQFGAEIGQFQALQHRMAQILLEIEQARSAVINAAAAMTQTQDQRDRMVSAAKYSIGRIGTLVAEDAIQMHGGIGMTWEYDMGHFAKRLVMIDHALGDTDYHLARFMALSAA